VRIVDLTGETSASTWSYGSPYPPVEITKIAKIEEIGYDANRIVLTEHTGTHMESPSHFLSGGIEGSEVPLDTLIGEAQLFDVSEKGKPLACITREDFEIRGSRLKEGDIAVIRTGWDSHWNAADYVSATPYISNEAAEWLVEKRVKLVAIDTPILDDPRISVKEELLPDKILVRHGIPYINGLVNLGAISSTRFRFMALPLKIKGVSGAPVRVIGLET
jgi:kynurenine formamidase